MRVDRRQFTIHLNNVFYAFFECHSPHLFAKGNNVAKRKKISNMASHANDN